MKVKLTLKRAEQYFDLMRKGKMKKEALSEIGVSLTEHLWSKIYTESLHDVFSIDNAAEMRSLIKSGGFPRIGYYNSAYYDWKYQRGLPPHELSGEMKKNTVIDVFMDRVLFYISDIYTTRTRISHTVKPKVWPAGPFSIIPTAHVYNFGPIHEKRKSVLKATVVFAWNDIRNKVRSVYKKYLES